MSQVGASEGGPQRATTPSAPAESTREDQTTGAPDAGRAWRPAPHKNSTKGGAGAAAGATPKKAYRPSSSSRPRPAGKKPDSGTH